MQVDCDHGLHWSIENLHILAEICSLDILYLERKSLMRSFQVNFGHILPESSKSSAFWDMDVNSNLKWLLLFSPDEVGEVIGTSLLLMYLNSPLVYKQQVCSTDYQKPGWPRPPTRHAVC